MTFDWTIKASDSAKTMSWSLLDKFKGCGSTRQLWEILAKFLTLALYDFVGCSELVRSNQSTLPKIPKGVKDRYLGKIAILFRESPVRLFYDHPDYGEKGFIFVIQP
jgi:hypothetical protein